MTLKKSDLFTRVLLFTVVNYIRQSREDGVDTEGVPDRIAETVILYAKQNPITIEEQEMLKPIADSGALDISNKGGISFVIFVMELVKMWALEYPKEKRPLLSVGERNLKKGKGLFTNEMLAKKFSKKKEEKEEYTELKKIINDSQSLAQEWYTIHRKELWALDYGSEAKEGMLWEQA